jgi:hypothetical protein
VFPVFLAIQFAIFEFGHAYMVSQLLKSAARSAARIGVAEGKTTADVIAKVNEVLASGVDPAAATIYVKDGSGFDQPEATPPTNYDELADVDLEDLEERQLFIVRIEIDYSAVSLFPIDGWTTGITISGQAVMRHE